MRFDREIIDVRIEKIRANLNHLKELAKLPFDRFKSGFGNISVTERLLQTSIEAMLDIGSHIIAVAGYRAPSEYKDVFVILGEEGIIDQDFVKTLTDMVGLRNKLVHVYMEIEPQKLYEFITSELKDFERFIAIIYKYVVEHNNTT